MKPEELIAHGDFIRALARRLIHDADLAADVAQQTMTAALEHPPSEEKPLTAWLVVVARNFARRIGRRSAQRLVKERTVALADSAPSTEEVVEREEIRSRVVDAVLGLAEPYRSTLLLRFYEDLPLREVARRSGVPTETARTRQKRGLAQLRKILDDLHDGDRKQWCLALAPLAGIKAAVAGSGAATSSFLESLVISAKAKAAAAVLIAAAVLTCAVVFLPDKRGDHDLNGRAALAEAPEFSGDERAADGDGTLNPDQLDADQSAPTDERIPLEPAAARTITGVVVDAETKQPLPGLTVCALESENEPIPRADRLYARTDEKGSFTFTRVPWKFCRLRLDEHHRHCKGMPSVSFKKKTTTANIVINAKRGVCLRVRVLDKVGRPAAFARVSTGTIHNGCRTLRSGMYCDDKGYLLFNRLKPGSSVAFLARSGSGPDLSRPFFTEVTENDEREIILTLEGDLCPAGRVEDEAGAPVANVEIRSQLICPEESDFNSLFIPGFIGLKNAGRGVVMSDAQGRFRMGGFTAGAYRLETRSDDYLERQIEFVLRADGSTVPREIVLVVKKAPQVIVRAVDETGQPVPEAVFEYYVERVSTGQIDRYSRNADESGAFEVPRLEEGDRVHVVVAAFGYVPCEIPELDLSERESRAVLKRGGVFSGRVVAAVDRAPITDFEMEWNPREKDLYHGEVGNYRRMAWRDPWILKGTDDEGRFTFEGLPDGVHHFMITADGFIPKTAIVEIVSGAAREKTTEFELEHAYRLSGSVLRAGTREPMISVCVEPRRCDPSKPASPGRMDFNTPHGIDETRTNAEGRFTLHGLPVGTYELRIEVGGSSGGYWPHGPISVGPGRQEEPIVILVEENTGCVVARVVDHQGEPVAGATVGVHGGMVNRDGFRGATGTTGTQGTARVHGVRHGERRVTATFQRGITTWSVARVIEVAARGETLVDLAPCAPGAGARVHGRVLAAGKPLTGLKVGLWSGFSGELSVKTVADGAQGEYSLAGIPPGNYIVRCGEYFSKELVVDEGRKEISYDIVLDEHRIEGRLRVKELDSFADATLNFVYLYTGTESDDLIQQPRVSAADDEGRFLFEFVDEGRHFVYARVLVNSRMFACFMPSVESWKSGERDRLDVVLEKAAALDVIMSVGSAGQPEVFFLHDGGDAYDVPQGFINGTTWQDDSRRRYKFEYLVAGTYRIVFPGGKGVQHVTLAPGDVKEVREP